MCHASGGYYAYILRDCAHELLFVKVCGRIAYVLLHLYVYAYVCFEYLEKHIQEKDALGTGCPFFSPLSSPYSLYFTKAAGHLQLGELRCSTSAALAQSAYLALFPTWWDRSDLMRDCS